MAVVAVVATSTRSYFSSLFFTFILSFLNHLQQTSKRKRKNERDTYTLLVSLTLPAPRHPALFLISLERNAFSSPSSHIVHVIIGRHLAVALAFTLSVCRLAGWLAAVGLPSTSTSSLYVFQLSLVEMGSDLRRETSGTLTRTRIDSNAFLKLFI